MNTISQDELKSKVHYNPETGVFIWLIRPEDCPQNKGFNSKYAGKRADYKRNVQGYRAIFINETKIGAHRLAWLYQTGQMPIEFIDHVDGEPSNNKFSNLREATNQENCRNRRRHNGNKTGAKNVYQSGTGYQVLIHNGEKVCHYGQFKTISEAEARAIEVRNELFGSFARHV